MAVLSNNAQATTTAITLKNTLDFRLHQTVSD